MPISNETKIVKAESTKDDADKKAGASKVKIKAVDVAIIEAQQKKRAAAAKITAAKKAASDAPAEEAKKTAAGPRSRSAAKPLIGTPMPKSSRPAGKAMPKSAVPQKKSEVPQPEKEDEIKLTTELNKENTTEAVIEEKPKKTRKKTEASAETATKTRAKKKKEEAAEGISSEKPIESPVKEKPEKEPEEVALTDKPDMKSEEATAAEKPDTESVEVPAKGKPAKTEAAETPVKEEIKTEPVSQKPETRTEGKKPERKTAKTAKKQAVVDTEDFLPNIGVKIIRRAADAPKQPQKSTEKKAEGKSRTDRKKGGAADARKPKEYIGKKGAATDGDDSPRKKKFPKTDAKGEKVVAYTSSQSGDNRGKKGKDKDRDKKKGRSTYDTPRDLSRNIRNKRSKYKEAKVEEVEVVSREVKEAIQSGGYVINVPITVAGFCEQTEVTTSQAIMALMKMGIMANINQNLDEETAVLLGMELGITVAVNKAEEIVEEEGIDTYEDRESDLVPRPPVVTVMGHVDHGKTSILDAIRKTDITAGEAGGITQHIGASEVLQGGRKIVFLDTPGHEAFTAMRARGAHITDIAVLVVAADDSVMPQTIESINHAKAAGVPIIVAMNKMDKPTANPDKVKKDLATQGLLVEDWGGDVICVPCSAKTGMGIPQLLEMILLQAEMIELKANPNRLAQGTVIEARLDKNRGPVATLLVMNGTLQAGAAVVAGMASGRVRVMANSKGETIRKAGPATAVEIAGLTDVPEAGDEFDMVKDEKTAREIVAKRREKMREEVLGRSSAMSLEKLFSQMSEGEVQDLNLIIKADVQGSVGALEQSLEGLHNDNVRVQIIHTGVGTINESDVMLAGTSNAVIIGFNVRPSTAVEQMAEYEGVEIRTYRVIYEIIDDIEAAMKGMLAPEFKESVIGKIEVRDTFKVPNTGVIAGGYVLEGKVARGAKLRLLRDGIVIHEGEISSLRRFKDDVKEVNTGYECGIGIEKYNDIKIGDIIEAYKMVEVERK